MPLTRLAPRRPLAWRALVFALPLMACNGSGGGSACASAGGTCLLGSGIVMCAKQAASSAQDCNTSPPNPGGGFCCLEFQEAGAALGTPAADADGSIMDAGVE